MSERDWPDPGGDSAADLEILKAKLARIAEQEKANHARAKAEVDTELTLFSEFHKALLEGARSGIDRSRSAADTVQKAATGILALYTAVLGVSFSVADNPLPSRGVLPALFLGLAVVFSTAYLAYLSKPRTVTGPTPQSSLRAAAMERTRTFIQWAGAPVSRRAYWLRASVVALGVALMFIPAPFISGSFPYVERLPWNNEDKTEEALPSELPDWPPVPESTRETLELWKIRYAAQVKEAATAREKFKPPGEPSYANQSWWLAAGIGLFAVLVAPLFKVS